MLLVRHRDRFAGRVVDIGCGGGRLLSYLVQIARRAEGIDISSSTVRYCATAFAQAHVTQGDLRTLSACLEGAFDVVLTSDNIIDILDDAERRRVLPAMRERYPARDGLLVFSTHNLAHMEAPAPAQPGGARQGSLARTLALSRKALHTAPEAVISGVVRRRREAVNRRRLHRHVYGALDAAVDRTVAGARRGSAAPAETPAGAR